MSNYCSECTYLDLSSGDIYGKFWCEKRLERHLANELECNRFCRAYSRDSSVERSAYEYSIEHSSSGGCYLTTMICDILGYNDNNEYLNTMRTFRNNILQKEDKYKPLLIEYDIIGPKISKVLNNDPLKNSIALFYFNKFILPITNLIKNNKKEEAINSYIVMTNNLKNFYGISNTISSIEIDAVDINESGHGIYKVKKITSM